MLVEQYIYVYVYVMVAIIIYRFKLITRYIIIHDISALSEINFVIRFKKNYYCICSTIERNSLIDSKKRKDYDSFFFFNHEHSFEKEKTVSLLKISYGTGCTDDTFRAVDKYKGNL